MNLRQIVSENDKLIAELVLYKLTEGGTKSIEQDAFFSLFKEFKGLTSRGEMTLQELEADILARYGICKPLIDDFSPTIEEIRLPQIDMLSGQAFKEIDQMQTYQEHILRGQERDLLSEIQTAICQSEQLQMKADQMYKEEQRKNRSRAWFAKQIQNAFDQKKN